MPGPNQIPGPTAIRSPTPDIGNHQTVLTQLKETTETAQRLRGNPDQSYVTLGELINAGIVKFLGGVVSPGPKIGGGGGAATVHVADSITGNGSVATPLQLSGDSASPGNLKLYGTNGSGAKGWYAQPTGGSITVTDGTHTVTGTTNLTFSGATVSGSTPNATVTVSGASVALPGTIPDLQTWFESDDILGASGAPVPRLRERTPWITGLCAQNGQLGSLATINAAALNSLNVIAFNPSASIGYTLQTPIQTSNGCTYFVVIIPNNNVTGQAIAGGAATSLCLYQNTAGANQLTLISGSTAVLASATTSWVAGTAFQANVTYNISTGAYAFRQVRASAGSGTVTAGVGNLAHPVSFLGGDTAAGTAALLVSSSIALFLAYNRVLTGPEIANIEAYILAKWGV